MNSVKEERKRLRKLRKKRKFNDIFEYPPSYPLLQSYLRLATQILEVDLRTYFWKKYKNLLLFSYFIKRRLRKNWDIVLAISGEEGVGKSSLALWLGYLVDKRFDLLKNVAYLPTPQEIRDKFYHLDRFQILIIDEAIRSLHKYGWMEKLQRMLLEMYATERKQNKCSIMCIPRFKDLSEFFLRKMYAFV